MCGRFALFTPPVRMARYFQASLADGVDPEQRPCWNVAPTTQVLAVETSRPDTTEEGTRRLVPLRWGLIPSWAKDTAAGNRLFNARGETVATKPSFRNAFKARRVIIPADGFYEWQATTDGKQPHFFTRTDGAPLALAGIAEWWRDKSDPEAPPIRSCSIITTAAGADMDGVHDRMPVILEPDTFDLWLDPEMDEVSELTALLRHAPPGTITHHAVSSRVGSVRNDDSQLIDPL
jgi:putative SOS response-associated peptidase YedK